MIMKLLATSTVLCRKVQTNNRNFLREIYFPIIVLASIKQIRNEITQKRVGSDSLTLSTLKII